MSNAKWPKWLMMLTVAGVAAAQNDDPLQSPACLRALDALQVEVMAARASAAGMAQGKVDPASIARIVARQKFAAGTCLGAWMDAPPQVSRTYQPPIQVSPVTGLIAHPPPIVVAAPLAPSPVRPALKPSIVSCDLGGCVTSDGTRLSRVGGLLLGPNGICAAQVPGQVCP